MKNCFGDRVFALDEQNLEDLFENLKIFFGCTLIMSNCSFNKDFILGAAAYQLGNTSSRTITEVKQR